MAHEHQPHEGDGHAGHEQFGKDYWEAHWTEPGGDAAVVPAHPALEEEIAGLAPGTALDAGSGEGAEAAWLAAHGWSVTAVDLSAEALGRAAARAPEADITWIEADLTEWQPEGTFDLVTTFYAHPTIPQLAFYARISRWVAPGGTLLIVGHRHGHGHGAHEHPEEAVTSADAVQALLDPAQWRVETAVERGRTAISRHGDPVQLQDVVVRAVRR